MLNIDEMAFFNSGLNLGLTKIYNNIINVNTINESTTDAGVTIENITHLDGFIQVADISAPSNASDGQGRIYKKVGNPGVFWLPDSAGAEVNMATTAGVTRSGSTTDNALPRWNGTNADSIQNSGIIVDDSNHMSGIASLVLETGSNDTTISATTQTVGAPTINIPDLAGTSGDMMITNASQTITNKTISSSTWSGGTVTGLTTLSINDNATRNLTIASSSSLTAGKTLTFNVQNADRTISLAGNLTTSGANALTFTTVGSTNVTLPTSGTLLTGLVSLTTGVSGVLPVANGGTNSSTALSGNSIAISDGTKIVQGAAGTTTTVLHGNAAGAPTYSAVSLTADVSGTLGVGSGGTGQTSYTDGQLLIGNTSGNTLTKATLTAGTGITITNGGGSITIAASPSTGVNAVSFTSGSGSWSIPNGTTFVRFLAIGAGGGGGKSGLSASGGGGAAGGAIINYKCVVGGNTSISYSVASKGTGGVNGGGNATAGGNTTITIGNIALTAYGGGFGSQSTSNGNGGGSGGGAGSNGAGGNGSGSSSGAAGTGSATPTASNAGIYNAAGGIGKSGNTSAGTAGVVGTVSFYYMAGSSGGSGGGFNGAAGAAGAAGGPSFAGIAGGVGGTASGAIAGGGGGGAGLIDVGGAGGAGNSGAGTDGGSASATAYGSGGGGASSGSHNGGDGAGGLIIIEYW
jgi:hypothetical protein